MRIAVFTDTEVDELESQLNEACELAEELKIRVKSARIQFDETGYLGMLMIEADDKAIYDTFFRKL